MTKRKVNILIGLMLVALLGIIGLQLLWLNNAYKVRNELFDRSVNEAMIASAKRLEMLRDVFYVHDIMNRPDVPPRPPAGTGHIYTNRDSLILKSNPGVRTMSKWSTGSNEVHFYSDDSSEIKVEIVAMDSVIDDIGEKIEKNITFFYDDSLLRVRTDSLPLRKKQLQKKFEYRVNRLKDVAGKMVYETWSMEQNTKPDTSNVNRVLKEELHERGVPIEFEFGVSLPKGEMHKTTGADSMALANTRYSAMLNPNDIFRTGEELLVYFPKQRAFVLEKLIIPAVLSLVFCLFIMLVFALSIYYIVNQKKISEMKTDFINNMTHEFKTPLATISVAADSIVNPKVIEDKKQIEHFSSMIKKENKRMNQQVETILQIARLDRKDFEFKFEVLNVNELIEKAVQGISIQVDKREGQIEMDLNASNSYVTADRTHLLNVLNNLLDNANKYSPEKPEISISTKNTEKGLVIGVSDRGIGMSKQVEQKVFEKFYRASGGNIHNVKGFGLGLSYAKAVVEANGGDINVNSEQGKGSTFEIFLPFTKER